jgi:hypothetical protein
MANLILSDQLIERLQRFAAKQNLPIEAVLSEMLTYYEVEQERSDYTRKLYAQARTYWQRTNDTERLSLTDTQLDEQFWCIDPEGIPRLKVDQDKVTLPSDGLLNLLESVWQENPSDEVEAPINYREILNKEFPDYLMHRIQGNNANTDLD